MDGPVLEVIAKQWHCYTPLYWDDSRIFLAQYAMSSEGLPGARLSSFADPMKGRRLVRVFGGLA